MERYKKKFDRRRIESDRSMEDQMDWRRDGRKKRIYTYVYVQRKYDVVYMKVFSRIYL